MHYTDNDLLDLEIKYKNDHTVIDLIRFIQSRCTVYTGGPSTVMYSGKIEKIKQFRNEQGRGEFRDGITVALEMLDVW